MIKIIDIEFVDEVPVEIPAITASRRQMQVVSAERRCF